MKPSKKPPKHWDHMVARIRERVEMQDNAKEAGWGGSTLIGVDFTLAEARHFVTLALGEGES